MKSGEVIHLTDESIGSPHLDQTDARATIRLGTPTKSKPSPLPVPWGKDSDPIVSENTGVGL